MFNRIIHTHSLSYSALGVVPRADFCGSERATYIESTRVCVVACVHRDYVARESTSDRLVLHS